VIGREELLDESKLLKKLKAIFKWEEKLNL
jgi:hypothetical protein